MLSMMFFYNSLEARPEQDGQVPQPPAPAPQGNRERENAFLHAAMAGRTVDAERLLDEGVNINARLEDEATGATAIHYAAMGGHQATVAMLLRRGADIDTNSNTNQITPLVYARLGNQPAMEQFLLSNGADPFHLVPVMERLRRGR
jgi:ankyrin repeat protein